MNETQEQLMQYINEEDVKFIRLAFCDIDGTQKNISIMPHELSRALSQGIAVDGSAIRGFAEVGQSDLFLHPDPATVTVLPWRPEHGRVVRMFCSVRHPDGTPLATDCRYLLSRAVAAAREAGVSFSFGAEMEFYLFRTDENGNPTHEPHDHAGYMDLAPADRGENVRREICLTLERMGILPESSHHEEGPGQNEVDFRYADPMTAADNAVTFLSVVRSVAARNGLYADFSPKPLPDSPGNSFHINLSAKSAPGVDLTPAMVAGILAHIQEMTLFFNPLEASYHRLGGYKAPRYADWSACDRTRLIRIPAAQGDYRRLELRSPDPAANPYLAFTCLIYAALDGIRRGLTPCPEGAREILLPRSLKAAREAAAESSFLAGCLPREVLSALCN